MKFSLSLVIYVLIEAYVSITFIRGQNLIFQGSSPIAVKGDSFQFKCSVSGSGSLQKVLLFYRDDVPMCSVRSANCSLHANIGGYSCGCYTGETRLFYTNITSVSRKDDNPKWFCQFGEIKSNVAGLEVYYPPTINIPNETDVEEDTSPNIDCGRNIEPGNPESVSNYIWTGSDGYNKTGRVLDRTVNRTQSGHYICTATNTAELSDTAEININVQYAPSITSVPTDFNVTENMVPGINCSDEILSGNPSETSYLWTGPDGYNEYGAVLKRNVSRTRGGQYNCIATNTAGLSDTAEVNINVQYPPKINLLSNTEDLIENSALDIDCSNNTTSGNPSEIFYIWTGPDSYSKDGAVLDRNFSRIQGGVYTCTASNTADLWDTAHIDINVLYAPTINIPRSVSVTEDNSLNIDCAMNITLGNPSNISYEWTGPDEYNDTGAILVRNMSRSQGGQYSCIATNPVGLYDTATVNISVNYYDFPRLVISPSHVMENDSVDIICNVTSNPTVQMTITNVDNTSLVEQETTNSYLYVIKSVQCLQNGTYWCLTYNEQIPRIDEISSSLNVSCSPRHDFRKPLKQTFFREIGETVTMTADIIANPLPTFTWWRYVNNQLEPIANYTDHTIQITDLRSTLQVTVTHARAYGTYLVKAENYYGKEEIIYTLSSISEPLTPDEVSVANITLSTVTLQWKSNNDGGSEQTFSVDYRTEDSDWVSWRTGIPDSGRGTLMKTEVTGLKQNTKYMLQVYAINAYGTSTKVIRDATTSDNADTTSSEDRLGHGLGIGFGLCLPVIVILSFVAACNRGNKRRLPSGFPSFPIFQAQQTVHVEIRADAIPSERNFNPTSRASDQMTYEELDSLASPAEWNRYIDMDQCKPLPMKDLQSLEYEIPVKDEDESVYEELPEQTM